MLPLVTFIKWSKFLTLEGCDASILLDDSATIVNEKNSGPNKNSLRCFEVIDEIKAKLEEACHQTISCVDIISLVARGSIVLVSQSPNFIPTLFYFLLIFLT